MSASSDCYFSHISFYLPLIHALKLLNSFFYLKFHIPIGPCQRILGPLAIYCFGPRNFFLRNHIILCFITFFFYIYIQCFSEFCFSLTASTLTVTVKSIQVKLSFIVNPLHVGTYSGMERRASLYATYIQTMNNNEVKISL